VQNVEAVSESRLTGDVPGPADPTVLPIETPSSGESGFGRRELLAVVISLAAGGFVTFGMLTASAARPSGSLPPAEATRPAATPSRTAAPRRTWHSGNPDWTGTDRHAVAFELLSENRVQAWQRMAQPILVVRCIEKHTEAFVYIESAAQIEPQPNHAVRIRIDNAPEREERWPDTEEHDALFAPDSAAFAHQLIGAKTMRFGYKPHNAAPVVAEFNVDGLATLIEPAAALCAWKR
jgi:hypothetical protein